MKKLTEEQENILMKIKEGKELVNGLFECLEKTFDSIFEIEWSTMSYEIDKKEENKQEEKPKRQTNFKKKLKNEVILPQNS